MLTVTFSVLLVVMTLLPTPAKGSKLTVLYSNDIRGEIEPCG